MLNQIVLVGRLTKDPEIITHDNNIKRTAVDLAVPRSYKNVDGVYETDYIRCVLWNGIAKNTCEYCKKGDLIGIRFHHMQYFLCFFLEPFIYMGFNMFFNSCYLQINSIMLE